LRLTNGLKPKYGAKTWLGPDLKRSMKIENDAIKLMLKREKDETSRIPGNRKRQPTERRPDQSAPWNWCDLYRPID
jgi:hypothetical protein